MALRNQSVFRGDRLKHLRKVRGWSQEHIAEQVEISRPQVANLENLVSEPSLRVLVLLAVILETSTDYLLDVTNDPGSKYLTELQERTIYKSRKP